MNISKERDRLDWLENQNRPSGGPVVVYLVVAVVAMLAVAWVWG